MTIIATEIQKWKRNKIVWCILALTLLFGAFAIERACSIARSSPYMDSFGDLYTLAFKNLSSLFLPIVLGMFATTLFFDEHKNDTLKELLIIPITKAQLYFSKVAVVILMSVGLCLITFLLCVVGGLIAGGFSDLNAQTLMDAGLLYLTGGLLIPIAMLPIVFLATLSKGYILPIGMTLLYLVPVVIAPAYLTGIHPLASVRGKIFCAHCGHSLHRQKCVRKKTPDVYVYHCISNNRIKKGACPGTFIFEKELLDALADMIQEQLDTTLGQYSIGLESLSKEAEEQKSIQAKIASRKQEIQQLRTYQRGLYEGLIQNHLSQDEYFAFKEKYEAKIEAVSKEIEHLKAGLAIIAGQLEQYKMLSQDAKHIKEDRQLTAALIDRLIERVEVSREKQITVHFRFQSEFEHCEEVLNQCRNM